MRQITFCYGGKTLHKADNLRKFDPEEFDCIVLDEAHQ